MISFISLVVYLTIILIIMFYSVTEGQSALIAFFQSVVLVGILSGVPALLGVLIGMNRRRIQSLQGRPVNDRGIEIERRRPQ
mgnify:CR=1 FL=1